MGTPYALGDLAQFSEAKPPAGPLPGVQELCSVALDGYAPAFGWLGVSRMMVPLTSFTKKQNWHHEWMPAAFIIIGVKLHSITAAMISSGITTRTKVFAR